MLVGKPTETKLDKRLSWYGSANVGASHLLARFATANTVGLRANLRLANVKASPEIVDLLKAHLRCAPYWMISNISVGKPTEIIITLHLSCYGFIIVKVSPYQRICIILTGKLTETNLDKLLSCHGFNFVKTSSARRAFKRKARPFQRTCIMMVGKLTEIIMGLLHKVYGYASDITNLSQKIWNTWDGRETVQYNLYTYGSNTVKMSLYPMIWSIQGGKLTRICMDKLQ